MKNETRQMVMATAAGFYRSVLVQRGQTFALITPSDFTTKWMVKAPADVPDMIPAPDPRRATRPGERPAVSVLAPLPAVTPTKSDTTTPTGDQAVI